MFHHQTPGGSVILLPTHHSSPLPCHHSVHTSDLPREWRVYLPFERGFSLSFSYLVSFCLAGLPLFSHQVRSLLSGSHITRNQGTHPSLWLSCPLVSVISSIQWFGESPNILGTAVEPIEHVSQIDTPCSARASAWRFGMSTTKKNMESGCGGRTILAESHQATHISYIWTGGVWNCS